MIDRDYGLFGKRASDFMPRHESKYEPGVEGQVVKLEEILHMMRDPSRIASGLNASREATDQGRGER